MKKKFPFRKATLEERKEFYEKEFSIAKARNWFFSNNLKLPQLCAIDAGSESSIVLNKKWKNFLFYFEFKDLEKKIKKYIPEDIYYDRNFYEKPEKVLQELNFSKWKTQELVFDIDVDNLNSKCRKGKIREECINLAYKHSIKIQKKLNDVRFKKIVIVYSGDGFHVHVLDKNAFYLAKPERKKLTEMLVNYAIDSWVSGGNINLIRLPYTLHGLVSRIVIPIENEFKIEKAVPDFLKN